MLDGLDETAGMVTTVGRERRGDGLNAPRLNAQLVHILRRRVLLDMLERFAQFPKWLAQVFRGFSHDTLLVL
jgi:hypothetical protein